MTLVLHGYIDFKNGYFYVKRINDSSNHNNDKYRDCDNNNANNDFPIFQSVNSFRASK